MTKDHGYSVLERFVRWLASVPSVFDGLRWILEGGYRGHESVFRNELSNAVVSDTSQRVLDIGCGTGLHAPRFTSDCYHGVDLSDCYIRAARSKFPTHQFDVGDARQLTFSDDSFQTVLISGLLHHLNDDDVFAVLSEAVRVLALSGSIVIWEDIPTTSLWNPVGAVIHRLDQGEWIRTPDQYRQLIEHSFCIESERTFRSGFMDYVVFHAHPKSLWVHTDSCQNSGQGEGGAGSGSAFSTGAGVVMTDVGGHITTGGSGSGGPNFGGGEKSQ